MTKKCIITIKDEVWCYVTGLLPNDVNFLWNKFGIYVEGYFFMPSYKLGRWDGKIRFFEKTGKTYYRLLDQILPYIEEWKYDIELVDNRKFFKIPEVGGEITKVDEHGIALEGTGLDLLGNISIGNKPFALRPYQLQCVKDCVEAGSGFIIAGTGAGKTSITGAISHVYSSAGYKTITIVPSSDLADQTYDWYVALGLDTGKYSGDCKDVNHDNVVATWQALQYNPDILADFYALIWDECFAGSTKILMADLTWKRIDEISVGDLVMSMTDDNAFEPQLVEKVHKNLVKSKESAMIRLTFDNGASVEVTENHLFYLKDGRKVAAKDLTSDDEIAEFSLDQLVNSKQEI